MSQVLKLFLFSIFGENNRLRTVFVLSVLFAVILSIYIYTHSTDQSSMIASADVEWLTEVRDVKMHSSDGQVRAMNLPVMVDPGAEYWFSFIVPKRNGTDLQFIHFNLYYATCTIKHEDEVLFSNADKTLKNPKSGGKSFNLIKIPRKYYGKELKIFFKSNLETGRNMKIPELVIGAKANILRNQLNIGMFKFLSSLVLLFTGGLLFSISLYFLKKKHPIRSVSIVGLFALDLGFYMFTRSWIVYYYLHSSPMIYYLEYVCLIVMPLPLLLLFLNSCYESDYHNWRVVGFEVLVLLVFVNLMVQLILTLLGISEFILMQNVTTFMLMFCSLFLIVGGMTVKKEHFSDKYYIIFSVLPLIVLLGVVLIAYFNTYRISHTPYVTAAVLYFLMLNFIVGVRRYVKVSTISIEKSFYEELAYLDLLTNLKNRNAFNRTLLSLKNDERQFRNMFMFMIDMNGLKMINDSSGHNTGDEYIKATGAVLDLAEKEFNNVEAFRHAGDEFVIIAFDKNEDEIERMVRFIKEEASKYKNDESDFPLSLAVGYQMVDRETFELEGFDVQSLLHGADENMYADKAKYKENLIHG